MFRVFEIKVVVNYGLVMEGGVEPILSERCRLELFKCSLRIPFLEVINNVT